MHSDPTLALVQNASPEDLVLMLFEGAVRFGREAGRAVDAGDRPRAERLVARVRAIVRELERSLNPEAGAVSRHLAAIYEYVLRRLEPADVDAEIIEEVVADIEVLCGAWSALVARRQADVAPAVA